MRLPRIWPAWTEAMALDWKYNSRAERNYVNRGRFWAWIDDDDWGIYLATSSRGDQKVLYRGRRSSDFGKDERGVERRLFALDAKDQKTAQKP